MKSSYSLYEAKARLSALVRQVREGRRIVITLHGRPVAELRPLQPKGGRLEARIAELSDRGILAPAKNPRAPLKPGARKAGALKRFLESRD